MQVIDIYISSQAYKHFSREEKVLGQFFTPYEVADFIVSFIKEYGSIAEGGLACDPACGDGVFLLSLLRHGFVPVGFDIDEDVISLLSDEVKEFVHIKDGLKLDKDGKFNLVVGNPPFSSKYGRVKGEILKEFDLGANKSSQAIEILFLEKFIKLCSDDGFIGIILPHGIFSDLRLDYVRNYIRKHLSIIAVISLPRNIFRSNGSKTTSKTCILIGRKSKTGHNGKVLFIAINSIDELVTKEFKKKVFATPEQFLYPEFYLDRDLILEGLPKLGEFDVEIIQGRTKYGLEREFSEIGIPFISAKTITPIGLDFSKDKRFITPGSSMDNERSHVEIGDVIFVRVGVGCIGRTAVIYREVDKGIVDDWIYIIRSKDSRLSPFFLAFWFQTSIIQKEIRRLARGVGTMTIPISLVKEIPIRIPDTYILEKCEEVYKKIDFYRENKQEEEAKKLKCNFCKELESLLLGV